MGLIPDALIQLVLTIAFAVYCVMGLTFFVMGIVYMGDAGAVGSTGVYLMAMGLIMLIIGGIALFANQKQIWLILFVIELFNIALFLVLYCLIVIVLMMATDTTDPVRDATKETWEVTKPTLTIPGSDPDGDEVFTYCQTMSEGTACKDYYADAIKSDTCQFNAGYSPMEILNNCSILWDPPAAMGAGVNTGCADLLGKATSDATPVNANNPGFNGDKLNAMQGLCRKCESACMERQIQDVKDNLVPASLFVLGLIAYLAVTIVWNQIMLSGDIEGIPQTVGLVLNGALMALSFVLMISSGIGAWKASDACPKTADGCVPTSMIMLVLLGVSCFGLSAVAVFGTWKQIPIAVTVVTIVMVFVLIFMVLFGLILGMSTGVVMEDIEYYYDTQYPKLRSAMEKVDNSYCQMTKEQCKSIIVHRDLSGCTGASGDTPGSSCNGAPVQTDNYNENVAPDGVQKYVTFQAVKKHMYAEASVAAGETDSSGNSAAPTWLIDCKTTAICIYCGDLLQRTQTEEKSVYNNLVVAGQNGAGSGVSSGDWCSQATNGATCIEKAPNFQWVAGLTGATNGTWGISKTNYPAPAGHKPKGTWVDTEPTTNPPTGSKDAYIQVKKTGLWMQPTFVTLGAKRATAIGSASHQIGYTTGTNDGLGIDSLLCMGIDAKDRTFNDGDGVDSAKQCYGVFSDDEDNDYYNVRCDQTDFGAANAIVNLGQMKEALSAAGSGAHPCGSVAELDVESSDTWTAKVANFTKYDTVASGAPLYGNAKEALPYCEEAITEYVQDERYCKDWDDQSENQKWSYYSNCDSCSGAFYDFSFNLPGPTATKRQCLNFVVGHFRDNCATDGSASCFDAIHKAASGSAAEVDNTAFLINRAYDDGSSFCGYDDESCKTKIKWDIEGSMTKIGIAGAIFLGFFMATIYCTLVAIEHYKGGDDDDDDDDSDE
jgi:hypothetical protein